MPLTYRCHSVHVVGALDLGIECLGVGWPPALGGGLCLCVLAVPPTPLLSGSGACEALSDRGGSWVP